jgi:hypothetical protein
MKTVTIRQSATFKTSPHEVYEALMDSRKHSKFTDSKASISRRIGGKFTAVSSLPMMAILRGSIWSWCRTKRLSSHGAAAIGPRAITPKPPSL